MFFNTEVALWAVLPHRAVCCAPAVPDSRPPGPNPPVPCTRHSSVDFCSSFSWTRTQSAGFGWLHLLHWWVVQWCEISLSPEPWQGQDSADTTCWVLTPSGLSTRARGGSDPVPTFLLDPAALLLARQAVNPPVTAWTGLCHCWDLLSHREEPLTHSPASVNLSSFWAGGVVKGKNSNLESWSSAQKYCRVTERMCSTGGFNFSW